MNESKFQVICPITHKPEIVYCYFTEDPLLVIPNGCENSCGSKICQDCMRKYAEIQLESLR